MTGERIRFALECLGWLITVLWCVRTRTLAARLPEVPDLSDVRWDLCPTSAPGLIVVVPAKDEAETIVPAMQTLLAQDYEWLRIVAVDDRSTDGTGALLDELAADHPEKLDVVHITEAAEGWMGKTFAMEVATQRSRSEYVLFTDADVWFSPSILRRALAYAEITAADHLVVIPTTITKTWGESTVLDFLHVLGTWAVRAWRVSDPNARRDVLGVGAFNLLRREALDELGGLAPQRLAVVEDLTLARRMRAAGMRQRVAFAPGLVLVHWAPGAFGIIRGLTKNMFALANFRVTFAALLMLPVFGLFVLPLVGLGWWPTILPSLLSLVCIAVTYRITSETTRIPARYGWLYPLGVLAVFWAMLRSVVVTLWRRGVVWRGTKYPLRELRAHNSPFAWEWQAARERAESKRVDRSVRPSRWVRMVKRSRPGEKGSKPKR